MHFPSTHGITPRYNRHYKVPTFAVHYNAAKQTFCIPGVSQQFVTERCQCTNAS